MSCASVVRENGVAPYFDEIQMVAHLLTVGDNLKEVKKTHNRLKRIETFFKKGGSGKVPQAYGDLFGKNEMDEGTADFLLFVGGRVLGDGSSGSGITSKSGLSRVRRDWEEKIFPRKLSLEEILWRRLSRGIRNGGWRTRRFNKPFPPSLGVMFISTVVAKWDLSGLSVARAKILTNFAGCRAMDVYAPNEKDEASGQVKAAPKWEDHKFFSGDEGREMRESNVYKWLLSGLVACLKWKRPMLFLLPWPKSNYHYLAHEVAIRASEYELCCYLRLTLIQVKMLHIMGVGLSADDFAFPVQGRRGNLVPLTRGQAANAQTFFVTEFGLKGDYGLHSNKAGCLTLAGSAGFSKREVRILGRHSPADTSELYMGCPAKNRAELVEGVIGAAVRVLENCLGKRLDLALPLEGKNMNEGILF